MIQNVKVIHNNPQLLTTIHNNLENSTATPVTYKSAKSWTRKT